MTNMEKIQICQEIVSQIQAESRRPVCRLRFSRKPFAITDSHLGGVPYVPRDGQIPTDNDGHQLWLCAQINFAQMPRMDDFPTEGILQFFLSDYHADGGFGTNGFGTNGNSNGIVIVQGGWRIAYYPDVDETVTEAECRAKMTVPWEEASRKNMPRPANEIDLKDIAEGYDFLWRCPEVPLKMTFFPVERECVSREDYRFEILFSAALKARLPDADPRKFMPYDLLGGDTFEEKEALEKIYERLESGGCKMGGYPRYCQGDPRSWLKDQDLPLPPREWDTLLFQLDDDPFDYPAGEIGKDLEDMDIDLNGGTLNFLIRREDLKNRDFSRVMADWACT